MKRRFPMAISILFWLTAWWVVARLVNQSLFLPGPAETLRALWDLLGQVGFYREVGSSLLRILFAFFFSCILGLILGVPSALFPQFETGIEPFVSVMKSTPVMSFILLFILWFRLGMVPVAVGILMCFPLIYKNVVEGIRDIDPRLLQMAQVYRVSKWNTFLGITLRSIRPYMYSAMNVALGLAFRVIVAAEVLAYPRTGIGSRLFRARGYFATEEMFAWTFVIIFLSYLFELALKALMSGRRKGKHAGLHP